MRGLPLPQAIRARSAVTGVAGISCSVQAIHRDREAGMSQITMEKPASCPLLRSPLYSCRCPKRWPLPKRQLVHSIGVQRYASGFEKTGSVVRSGIVQVLIVGACGRALLYPPGAVVAAIVGHATWRRYRRPGTGVHGGKPLLQDHLQRVVLPSCRPTPFRKSGRCRSVRAGFRREVNTGLAVHGGLEQAASRERTVSADTAWEPTQVGSMLTHVASLQGTEAGKLMLSIICQPGFHCWVIAGCTFGSQTRTKAPANGSAGAPWGTNPWSVVPPDR